MNAIESSIVRSDSWLAANRRKYCSALDQLLNRISTSNIGSLSHPAGDRPSSHLIESGVYHFSPPHKLPPRSLDGVLRTEGKLLHLGRFACGSCEGGPVRTLSVRAALKRLHSNSARPDRVDNGKPGLGDNCSIPPTNWTISATELESFTTVITAGG
jgi:hypothetical protein